MAFVNGSFVAQSVRAPRTTRSMTSKGMVMSASSNQKVQVHHKLAALVSAQVAAVTMPAMAAEGTGAALGIEEPLLYIPLILVPALFFVLFLGFANKQPKDDFFGAKDDRRN